MSNCSITNQLCLESPTLQTITPFSLFYKVDPIQSDYRFFRVSLKPGPFDNNCSYSNTLQNFTISTPVQLNPQTNYTVINIRETDFIRNHMAAKLPVYFQMMDASIGTCSYSPIFRELTKQLDNGFKELPKAPPADRRPGWEFPVQAFIIMGIIAGFVVAVTLLVMFAYQRKTSPTVQKFESKEPPKKRD